MKDYIYKHRKLTIFVLAILVLLLVFTFILAPRTATNVIIDSDHQTGDDDYSAIEYKTPLFSIKGEGESSDKITIEAYSGYRSAAVDMVYNLGLNPTDYKITFNYESPFKQYE